MVWHIMSKAVKIRFAKNILNAEVIGADKKLYGKHHNYVTIV